VPVETWPLTIREERRLRTFDNVRRRIFGPKRDEVPVDKR
jgi:hypothetical protein